MKNAVLLTDDGRMHFHAKEVGVDSILIGEIDLKGIEYLLKRKKKLKEKGGINYP